MKSDRTGEARVPPVADHEDLGPPRDPLEIAESLIRRGGVMALAGKILRDKLIAGRSDPNPS